MSPASASDCVKPRLAIVAVACVAFIAGKAMRFGRA
jgi:hypothetical protein